MQPEPADLRERLQATLATTHLLERELGGGGMSRVFLAREIRLDRRVVVKVLHPDLAAGLSARRFEREVALAARLQHPHVVPVLGTGDVDGLPYYTMPFVEGESLRHRLARRDTCGRSSAETARGPAVRRQGMRKAAGPRPSEPPSLARMVALPRRWRQTVAFSV